jgi:heptosyltransferase III
VGSLLERLPAGSRVAILRLRSLGDCVLTTPALDILRRVRPDLHTAVVVEDRFVPIFEHSPDLDEILPPNLGALRRFQPSLCLNLHGGSRSAWMTLLSSAQFRAGFGHFRFQSVYNMRIPRAQEILGINRTVHTAEHLASAMFWLGAPIGEIPRAKLRVARDVPDSAPYAVIHAVAATPEKTWRADGFLAAADFLGKSGLEPVFIGAATDNLTPFRAWRTVNGAPLSEIKALMSRASVFVGNDSGPAHVAAAFGVPSVVIFGPSNPAIWGPWRTASEVLQGRVEIAEVLDALARLRVHV